MTVLDCFGQHAITLIINAAIDSRENSACNLTFVLNEVNDKWSPFKLISFEMMLGKNQEIYPNVSVKIKK